MRLSVSKSKNSTSLYIIESTYEKGKHSSRIVEKLGTMTELQKKLEGQDPMKWAKKYVEELNQKEKQNQREIAVRYSPIKKIPLDKKRLYNGGYLFLQKLYYRLAIPNLCKMISNQYKFTFDLNSILSRLIYGRIIFPSSKAALLPLSEDFLEPPHFQLQHIYRALEVIAKEMNVIQSELYRNSLKISKRNTGILYYDCTNFFFEIEQEEGLKQYGFGKDHKPNPIVGMGLFMDGDGIPLAFSIYEGNKNEQVTLQPLEKKILSDFPLSRMIVCTDAGLASTANRKFNDQKERAFITTQSIKKLKQHLKEWSLDTTGWHCPEKSRIVGGKKYVSSKPALYDLTTLDEENDKEYTFYKERWIKEDGIEQKLIVTYSLKYQCYQRKIRNKQIERAQKLMDTNPSNYKKVNQNDYKRLITKTNLTPNGEVADKELYQINDDLIRKEEQYDGFYAVCTNLEESAKTIIKINRQRWEIEECFRIMKSEFKARPTFLSRDDRIKAHFTTCFMSLILYRFLEKEIHAEYTYHEIIDALRNYNFYKVEGEGYIPVYTRTKLTDDLHNAFGFYTDYEIMNKRQMKKIFRDTKK